MQGYLFEGALPVEVLPEAVTLGGSWEKHPTVYPPLANDDYPLRLVYEYLKTLDAPVMIDIGASTGSFSLLPVLLPDLTVFAFEPNPTAFGMLQQHLRMNGIEKRVYSWQCALGNTQVTRELHIPSGENAAGLATLGMATDYGGAWTTVMVQQQTLDWFEFDSVDFIKIDVECAEKFVLEGAKDTIMRYRPTMLVEASHTTETVFGYVPKDIPALITSYGYDITLASEGNLWCTPN